MWLILICVIYFLICFHQRRNYIQFCSVPTIKGDSERQRTWVSPLSSWRNINRPHNEHSGDKVNNFRCCGRRVPGTKEPRRNIFGFLFGVGGILFCALGCHLVKIPRRRRRGRLLRQTVCPLVMVDPLKIFWVLTNSTYLGNGYFSRLVVVYVNIHTYI